jgi:hypothetical protein
MIPVSAVRQEKKTLYETLFQAAVLAASTRRTASGPIRGRRGHSTSTRNVQLPKGGDILELNDPRAD